MGRKGKGGLKHGVAKVLYRCGIFLVMVFYWLSVASLPADASGSRINCDPHSGTCIQTIGALEVAMEISPKPVKALQELVFQVTLSGAIDATASHIDLGMPAMKMGPNRVTLTPTGPGTFEGRGVIVAVGTVGVSVAVGGIGVWVGVALGGAGVKVCVEVGRGVGKAKLPVKTAPALLNPIKATIQTIITKVPKVYPINFNGLIPTIKKVIVPLIARTAR